MSTFSYKNILLKYSKNMKRSTKKWHRPFYPLIIQIANINNISYRGKDYCTVFLMYEYQDRELSLPFFNMLSKSVVFKMTNWNARVAFMKSISTSIITTRNRYLDHVQESRRSVTWIHCFSPDRLKAFFFLSFSFFSPKKDDYNFVFACIPMASVWNYETKH